MAVAAMAALACLLVVGIGSAAESSPAPVKPAAGSAAPAEHAAAKPAARPAPAPAKEPAAKEPAAKPAAKPAPAGDKPAARVKGTPCTATARACVDLDDEKAWLIDDGKVVRGPVGITTGDDEDPTPVGTFKVQWKAKEYTSREYLTQMPYSVFFADGGVAFHEGNQETPSAGCVKLTHDDAVAWFNFLEVGDEVQVH